MSKSVPPFLATDPDVYEHFMGRWSRRLAHPFLDFADIQAGDHVLGCRLWDGCPNARLGGSRV